MYMLGNVCVYVVVIWNMFVMCYRRVEEGACALCMRFCMYVCIYIEDAPEAEPDCGAVPGT
jgi:hypothetical protein